MIRHPLPQGTTVKAAQKTCACSGGKLDVGATIKSEMVQQVL
jgi:hypothetical protein